jgi:hypothetical protein
MMACKNGPQKPFGAWILCKIRNISLCLTESTFYLQSINTI